MWTLCLLQILPFAFSLQIPIEYLQHQFLHITDLHLDSFYKTGASTSSACHRKTPGLPAGEFGTPESNCDSPKRLVQDTLDYISGNFLLDFVVWTGDNARHDSDKELPRTLEHVLHENSQVSKMFLERFKVPVVPSIGNNDVHPHNLLKYQHEGNPLFAAYLDIWSPFIPMSQISTFKTLGSFITDVSDSISVVSLNTIFLFTSNSWVPDCGKHQGADLLLDWLESELLNARKSNRVILISGHVPPSVLNYKANCYARFSKLSLEYKDVIIGQLYGHMNVGILV
jgi:endopolyphosphatase